jgi:dTDP-4-dehydrorhamnose 3,5-epimerase
MDDGVTIRPTTIRGVVLIEEAGHADFRGAFSRLFSRDTLARIVGPRQIVQINHSRTENIGTIRGLHYQCSPDAEMKFVCCLKGRVWDVAIDLRAGSPTFRQWHGEELSSENRRMMVVPEGCAHGFQVLDAGSELLYLHTAFYVPSSEGGVRPTDPALSISWPLPVRDLSERDRNHPILTPDFPGLIV